MKQSGENAGNLSTKENIIEIIKGTIAAMILTIILLILFSILLTYTNIPETAVSPVVIIITAISILMGSSFSTIKIHKNGLLNGGCVGLIYILALYFLSSFITGTFTLNSSGIILAIASIGARNARRDYRSESKVKEKKQE